MQYTNNEQVVERTLIDSEYAEQVILRIDDAVAGIINFEYDGTFYVTGLGRDLQPIEYVGEFSTEFDNPYTVALNNLTACEFERALADFVAL